MFAIAAFATFVLTTIMAMAGVGAAFILVPIFLALGVEIHVAMATALFLNAISSSISTITFVRKKLVEWRLAIPITSVAVVLSPLGVHVSQSLDRQLLLWLFSGFLIFAGLMMLLYTPNHSMLIPMWLNRCLVDPVLAGWLDLSAVCLALEAEILLCPHWLVLG